MTKKLILNADDFGLTSGINYGILDAYLQHSISSISLMINTPKTLEAIEIMKKYKVTCVGIHINITLGKPVSSPSNIPSLLDEHGYFHKADWWFQNQVNENELILEFDNQIALFEKLTGQKPNHLNYHHRFDFYQYYPSLAKHLFEKYQLPMRLEKDYHEYPYEYAINQTYFLNTHDDIHKYLIGDIIEMPCHVGFVDQSIMEMSSLNLQRMEDHALVTSSRFKKLYHDLGYQLIGWNQLQKKTRNSY